MSEHDDLHAQLAQRLFGWKMRQHSRQARIDWCDATGTVFASQPPAYTTDPAATALVWQWLEGHHPPLWDIHIAYGLEGGKVRCGLLVDQRGIGYVDGTGASWQEALCRAALALAEAMEGAR